jgi:hypothetical protein
MHFSWFRSIVVSNPARPFWKMLAFLFLPAILGTSHCLEFVPLINTVLLLGAPVLPTRWVKISTYLQSEQFLLVIFYNLLSKRVNNICQNPNILVLYSS